MERNSRAVLPMWGGLIWGGHRGRESVIAETSSLPIVLHARMPQVPSPDTGEGLGYGQFGLCWPTQWASIGAAIGPPPMRRSSQRRTRLPRSPCRCGWQGNGGGPDAMGIADRSLGSFGRRTQVLCRSTTVSAVPENGAHGSDPVIGRKGCCTGQLSSAWPTNALLRQGQYVPLELKLVLSSFSSTCSVLVREVAPRRGFRSHTARSIERKRRDEKNTSPVSGMPPPISCPGLGAWAVHHFPAAALSPHRTAKQSH